MLWLLVASAAVVLLLSQSAVAKDRVLARDSHVARIWALDGTLVYERATGPFGQRPARRRWMRVVNGHVAPARGVPTATHAHEFVLASSIGLDRSGRVVMTFERERLRPTDIPGAFRVGSVQWWIYDVTSDSARRLSGLPPTGGDCPIANVSVWRERLAYGDCRALYVRAGKRTQRVRVPRGFGWSPGQGSRMFSLRGATLVAELTDFSDANFVWLLANATGSCRQQVPDATGGVDNSRAFSESQFWLSDRYITWTDVNQRTGQVVLRAAKLMNGCAAPELVGVVFRPPSRTLGIAVDGRFVYYAGPHLIRRHLLRSIR